ncbi:MAG: tyrosine-type recombinase/integrase [Acidimicrobiales bacterium]
MAGLRFHDLRSLAATALVAAGVELKTAQTRLGHSSPHVTLALYARATAKADRAAADSVGEHFRPRDRRATDSGDRLTANVLTWSFVVGARGLEPPTSAV